MKKNLTISIFLVITFFNIVLHGLGLIVAFFWMRSGCGLFSLEARMSYLSKNAFFWSVAWGIWMLCALALVAFLACVFLRTQGSSSKIVLIGLILTTVGAGIDLLCDVIQITILPSLAQNLTQNSTLFLTWDRFASVSGLLVANGFYSFSILLVTLALKPILSRFGTVCGYGTFLFGMLMVYGGFMENFTLIEISTGPTIGGFMIWSGVVFHSLASTDPSMFTLGENFNS